MPPTGIRRVFVDYELVVCPEEGAGSGDLSKYVSRWRELGVEVFVLAVGETSPKREALEAAKLVDLFDGVQSSEVPKAFPSKGDFLADQLRRKGWQPTEQLVVDRSVGAVASTAGWHFSCGDDARQDATAVGHTFRVPFTSRAGLSEADLQYLDRLVMATDAADAPRHRYGAFFEGQHFVDEADGDLKCLEFLLNRATFRGVLAAHSEALSQGRPDLQALLQKLGPSPKTLTIATGSGAAEESGSAASSVLAEMLNVKGKGKGLKGLKGAPPPKSSLPPKPKEKPAAVEGDFVEVVEGAYAGQRGEVVKVIDEGKETRWRVQLAGQTSPTWVQALKVVEREEPAAPEGAPLQALQAPPPKSSGPPPRGSEGTSQLPGEGDEIEVLSGPHVGKRGRVVKSSGQGSETRWRVAVDGGLVTWVDEVKPAGGSGAGGTGSAGLTNPPGVRPFEEGAQIQIADGPHTGKSATIVKVTGSQQDRRWKVQLHHSSSTTWVDVVQSADGVLSTDAASIGPTAPLPIPHMYLYDDSESEASDPDMPSLEPLAK